MTRIERVAVLGAGTIGQQVALQCAAAGCRVVLCDVRDEQLATAVANRAALARQAAVHLPQFDWSLERVARRIVDTCDPATALADADVVSESVTEDLKVKRDALARAHQLSPPHAIITSNSSYFPPSMLATASGRPDRFASLHFHVPVWYANAVDIMPHARTAGETVTALREFALRIGQTPIVCKRETPGYVFNTMLQALLASALTLVRAGIVDHEDLDRSWMAVTKMPIGPCGMLDKIGLDTVKSIFDFWGRFLRDPNMQKNNRLLAEMIAAGRLGEKSAHGFYTYPHPKFEQPGFVAQVATPARSETATPTHATDRAARFVPEPIAAACDPRIHRQPHLDRGTLLVGAGPLADALQRELQRRGSDVRRRPLDAPTPTADTVPTVTPARTGGDTTTVAVANAPEVPRLLMLVFDERATRSPHDAAELDGHRIERLAGTVQAWYAALVRDGLLDQAAFVVVARRSSADAGGDPLATGWAGFAKALFLESIADRGLGIPAKAIELSDDLAVDEAAKRVLDEMAIAQASILVGDRREQTARHADSEIQLTTAQRFVTRYRAAPLPAASPPANPRSLAATRWLLTGGARGITARIAAALAEHPDIELHLLGRSQPPTEDFASYTDEQLQQLRHDTMRQAYAVGRKPSDAWDVLARQIELQRNLRQLQTLCSAVHYWPCDVADPQTLARTVRQIQERGPIDGVVHGAGFERTLRFTKKSPGDFAATYRVKPAAAWQLARMLADHPPRFWVSFGSLSGRFGGIGQTDYAWGNDALSAATREIARQWPASRVVTIHWPGWQDVGMAARDASRTALARAGHSLLAPEEGVRKFLEELQATDGATDVLFVEPAELPSLYWL